jgi:uncharacterized protein (TIGR00725 family)
MMISVIGASNPSAQSQELAAQVGRELAIKGATVVCGGLSGIMESVSQGAKSAGGTTVGILPGIDPKLANEWIDIPICTGIGYARNVIVVLSGRAVIAIDGAYGTLSEIAHALSMDIPVVGLDTWNFSIDRVMDNQVVLATTPADAVQKALELAKAR